MQIYLKDVEQNFQPLLCPKTQSKNVSTKLQEHTCCSNVCLWFTGKYLASMFYPNGIILNILCAWLRIASNRIVEKIKQWKFSETRPGQIFACVSSKPVEMTINKRSFFYCHLLLYDHHPSGVMLGVHIFIKCLFLITAVTSYSNMLMWFLGTSCLPSNFYQKWIIVHWSCVLPKG